MDPVDHRSLAGDGPVPPISPLARQLVIAQTNDTTIVPSEDLCDILSMSSAW